MCVPVKAQQVKAWIFFTDKEHLALDTRAFFTPHNLQRKQLQGLPAYDWYDLPVTTAYITGVKPYCDSMTFVSRWLNAACVYTNETRLRMVEGLPYVQSVEITDLEPMLLDNKTTLKDLHQGEINLLRAQTGRMQSGVFHKKGLTGKNVTIAIIDGGFEGYMENPVLERMRSNKQVRHTYDFIRKRENVDAGSTHGTAVLSCITGFFDDSLEMGCAPDAYILLYRTEKAFSEKLREEEYWVAAMEEADRQGADIINTSLGYSTRRYFQGDMNGHKSILARASNIAAKKGVLVVCSAGNEGDINWKTICTPADADSALAVGAINPWTGIQAAWSSYGPNSARKIKPNVCAYGYAMTAKGSSAVVVNTGTSFSSPLVAGFAACIKQQYPQLTAMELMQKIESSGDLYPYFDYAHGYGVPQAAKALQEKPQEPPKTFDILTAGDSLKVVLDEKHFSPSFLQIRGYYTSPGDTSALYTTVNGKDHLKSVHFNDHIYTGTATAYVFDREPGFFYYKTTQAGEQEIEEYGVLNVRQRLIYVAHKTAEKKTYTFHHKGYTATIEF